MADNLPNDSDGDALRRLLRDGSDLSRPMVIDFCILVPNEEAGQKVASQVETLGFRADLQKDGNDPDWTCYCTRTMIPTYDGIIACQESLDQLARLFGGKIDGWGSFGNATEE